MAGQKAPPLLEAKELNAKFVFDLVYNPLDTPLLRLARQQGIAVITGVESSSSRAHASSRSGPANRRPRKRCCGSCCTR